MLEILLVQNVDFGMFYIGYCTVNHVD